jgi:hypothetical protein
MTGFLELRRGMANRNRNSNTHFANGLRLKNAARKLEWANP